MTNTINSITDWIWFIFSASDEPGVTCTSMPLNDRELESIVRNVTFLGAVAVATYRFRFSLKVLSSQKHVETPSALIWATLWSNILGAFLSASTLSRCRRSSLSKTDLPCVVSEYHEIQSTGGTAKLKSHSYAASRSRPLISAHPGRPIAQRSRLLHKIP